MGAIDKVDNSKSEYFPEIRNQGDLGSCVAWACGYYHFTYEMNRKLQRPITPENYNSVTFSPSWIYNSTNDGENKGTSPYSVYDFMKKQGCVTLEDLPYIWDYKTWSPTEKLWTKSLDYRLNNYKEFVVYDKDQPILIDEGPDDKDIQGIKAALANGDILSVGTGIKSWKCIQMPDNDKFNNKYYQDDNIAIYQDGCEGSHMMTIVGYDDNIWADINGNGNVDKGEMGAFKIANSWGSDWQNDGFIWVAYDALNRISAVNNVDEKIKNRNYIFDFIFRISVEDYNSDSNINLVYTLNSSDRYETDITIKADDYNGRIEPYNSVYINEICNNFSYNGMESANDGTMVYALDNVIPNLTSENFKNFNWSVTVSDNTKNENILTVKDLRIVDENTNTVYVPVETFPQELNGNSKTYTFKETKIATIYYRGYYNPSISYKVNDEVTKNYTVAQMNDDYFMIGYTQKFQIYLHGDSKTANVAFTDSNGNWDNNNGKYYTVRAGNNYFITENSGVPELAIDASSNDFDNVNYNKINTFNFSAFGGYAPYKFDFKVEEYNTSENNYHISKNENSCDIFFYNISNYSLYVDLTDQTGNTIRNVFNINTIDKNVEIDSFEASEAYTDKSMTFTATTLYEAMSYPIANQVTLTIKKDGQVVATPTVKCTRNISHLTSTFTATYTPTTSGSYSATISIKDYSGRTATKTVNFIPTLGISYASNDFSTPVNINTAQSYKFDTIGGYGPYTYTYTCYNMTRSTYDASIYPNSTGCTIYFRSADRHKLTVKSTDSKGNTKTYYFYPTAEDNHVELTSFNKTQSYVGGEMTFTATTRYEAMLYQIANKATLTIKKNGVVVATPTVSIKNKNMNTLCSTYSATWTPTVAGDYTATIVVTDYYGLKVEKYITFKVNPTLSVSNFEVSPSTSIGRFENVNMKATASGGAENYQYKYSYKRYGKEYIIKDYSSSNSYAYQFTELGPYQLIVTVKDCHGNTATATKSITISQTGIRSLTANVYNAKNGDTVIIKPELVCEPSVLTYKNYIYTVTKDNVTQEFNANSDKTFKWVPTEAGNYSIGLKITYNNTLIASKLMNYTVNQKYVYPITIYYKGFDTPYIKYQIDNGEWSTGNGDSMILTDEMVGYTHKYTIETDNELASANISFNDGQGNIDNNKGKNYTVNYGQFYKYENGTLTPYYPSKTVKSFNVTTDDGVFSVGDIINISLEMMNSSEYYEVRYSYFNSNNTESMFDSYNYIPNLNKLNGSISKAGEYKIVAKIRTSPYDYDPISVEKTIIVTE